MTTLKIPLACIVLGFALGACDGGGHVHRGEEVLNDMRGNLGLATAAFATCDVALLRAPLVVKGMSIYHLSKCSQGGTHEWSAAIASQLGLQRTDTLKPSQLEMLNALSRSSPEFARPFSAAEAYGIQICPPIARGDPVGVFSYVSDGVVVVVSYGGRLLDHTKEGVPKPLLDDCFAH